MDIKYLIPIFWVYIVITGFLYSCLVIGGKEASEKYGNKAHWQAFLFLPLWPVVMALELIFSDWFNHK